MRYKDHSPIFLDYWRNKYRQGYNDILFMKRQESKWSFLKQFIYVMKHRINIFGFYKAMHDSFVGTREL